MTAAALVRSVVAAGIRIRLDGDNIVLSGPARLDVHLIEELKSAKAEVLCYIRGLALWTEEDWSALYDERAGIIEFDGGLSRHEAEAGAAQVLHLLRSVGFGND